MVIQVDKSRQVGLFPLTENGNYQPYSHFLSKYELKLPTEITPRLLAIQIQIQAVCWVLTVC